MNARCFVLIAVCATGLTPVIFGSAETNAQDPFADLIDPVEKIKLFDSSETTAKSSLQSKPPVTQRSVAELRQARALYRANQRVARLEYNLWMGYEPLRPKWNAVPMMSSRYTRRKVYVPIYIRGR